MTVNSRKIKKIILQNIPFLIFGYAGDMISYAYRISEGNGLSEKLVPFMNNLGTVFSKMIPSFAPIDLFFGAAAAVAMKIIMVVKAKNRKKFRQGEEYGSASWGTQKDIEPYMDNSDPDNNVILTQTELSDNGKAVKS